MGTAMQLKRLTFDSINDLYLHPLYGARTLENIAYMEEVAKQPKVKPVVYKEVECSTEMFMRNERCIDENGFGMFGD
jgi:hypothetical protein